MAPLVGDVGNARRHAGFGKFLRELALDVEEMLLGLLDEHEAAGFEQRDLPAQLRADLAARR